MILLYLTRSQGCLAVGVYVAGVCFEPQDYASAWEGPDSDLERFIVRWESKEVIPVATAVQDWIKASECRPAFASDLCQTLEGNTESLEVCRRQSIQCRKGPCFTRYQCRSRQGPCSDWDGLSSTFV